MPKYQFHSLMETEFNHSNIAKVLEAKFNISRELMNNRGSKGYRPKKTCELSA